jgi:hypothetical protein
MSAYCRRMPPRTNKEIEDAAVGWVIEIEKQAGRIARDTRYSGDAADVSSPPRSIEIKAHGVSARGQELWLETRQFDAARRDADFWLYIVDNVRQGDPAEFRLIQIGGQELADLLRRATERHYYTVPFPVAVYDRLRQ